jgi:hypothetical protein
MLPRFYSRAFLFTVLYLPLLFIISQAANSAEWSMQPSVQAGREYNDNIRYTLQPHGTVYGTFINPSLDAGVRSAIWQLNGNIDYMQKRYPTATDLDSDDHRFNLSSLFQTERSVWQLSGSSAKSSLVTEQQSNTSTGVTQLNRVQDSRNIGPTWTWFMTELTRVRLAYQVSDVSYVDGASALLYDYRQQSTTISLLHQLNPQDLISVDAGYSYFRVPITGVVSRGASIQAGLTRQFTETLKGTITAGARNTATVIPGGTPLYNYSNPNDFLSCFLGALVAGEDWRVVCATGFTTTQRLDTTSVIYNINLENQFGNMQANLVLTKAVEPTAFGAESTTDSLTFGVGKPLSEKLSTGFSVYAYKTSTIAGNVTGVDRRYYQLEPRLGWQWTREASVNSSYRYSHLKRNGENMPVTANSVYLTLMYQWPKLSISR